MNPLRDLPLAEDLADDDDTLHLLAVEHRHAEELLGYGELDVARMLARRLVIRAVQLGQPHFRGAGYVTLARVRQARQQRDRFRVESLEALRHLDYAHDPALFLRVVFALSRDLLPDHPAAPRFGKLVSEVRQRRTKPDRVPWSLFRWLEGRVLQSRGRFPRAATVLSGARRRCLKLRAAHPAVAIALDLAEAHLEAGDERAAKVAVRDTVRSVAELDLGAAPRDAFFAYGETLLGTNGGSCGGAELEQRADRVRELLLSPETPQDHSPLADLP